MENSIKKARTWLESFLENMHYPPGSRLPSIRQLALDANVSTAAMNQAVNELKNEGKCTIIKGRGIFSGIVIRKREDNHFPYWKRIKEAIEKDIISGEFDFDFLPGVLSLSRRYHVCYQVIRKAIDALIEEDVLVRRYKKLYIKKTISTWSSLCFIGPGYESGKIVLLNDRFRECFSTVERLCSKNGLTFSPIGIEKNLPSDPQRLLSSGNRTNIGYIVWPNGMYPEALRRTIEYVIKTAKPVSIIDEIGDFRLPLQRQLTIPQNVRIFRLAAFKAGSAVARYLIKSGHHRLAFFSPVHSACWSRARLEGVESVIKGMKPVGKQKTTNPDEFSLHVFTPTIEEILLPTLSTETQLTIEHLFTQYQGSSLYQSFNFIPPHKAVLTALQTLEELKQWYKILYPQFGRILGETSVTAWIVVNDYFASIAIDFLREKGIKVPQAISVIGFDDWAELAYPYELSTFNFNFSAIGHRAFSFILNPRASLFRVGSFVIECDGLVIQRKTTTYYQST